MPTHEDAGLDSRFSELPDFLSHWWNFRRQARALTHTNSRKHRYAEFAFARGYRMYPYAHHPVCTDCVIVHTNTHPDGAARCLLWVNLVRRLAQTDQGGGAPAPGTGVGERIAEATGLHGGARHELSERLGVRSHWTNPSP